MANYRYYISIILSLIVFFALLIVLAVPYLTKSSITPLLEGQIDAGITEARQIAILGSTAIDNDMPRDTVIKTIQKAISTTRTELGFISLYDRSGKDISTLRTRQLKDNAFLNMEIISRGKTISADQLYTAMLKYKESDQLKNTAELIYSVPITNADWVITSHINVVQVMHQIKKLQRQFVVLFSLIALFTLLLILMAIRFHNGYHELQFVQRIKELEDRVLRLSNLGELFDVFQKKTLEIDESQWLQKKEFIERATPVEGCKKRILTYTRNELLPIAIQDIAYLYFENTITYVVKKDGKRSTSNESLSKIYSCLDKEFFFKANRQVVITISSIDRIVKMGNNQLRIQVTPKFETDIIIGKNKIAAFKRWLDI